MKMRVILTLALATAAGCARTTSMWDSGGETVPAAEPEEVPGTGVVGRYWAEVRPLEGRIDLYELHPGNVIYRGERVAAVTYDYSQGNVTLGGCMPSGNCLPPVNTVKLFTDQTRVIYKDSAGLCHSNGAIVPCPSAGPCANQRTFCAPIQAVSNYQVGNRPTPLPDAILQLAQQSNLANRILGCLDDAPGSGGLCAFTGAAKVDSTHSNLTSPIPGNPMGVPPTFGCSYCYGNSSQAFAQSLPGLKDALVSGLDPSLRTINTDTLALALQNDLNHNVTITVRFSYPTYDAPGSQITLKNGNTPVTCATPGVTTLFVNGGGFGPPGACLSATPPGSCPISGDADFRTGLLLLRHNLAYAFAPMPSWSDTQISTIVPQDAAGGLAVTTSFFGGIFNETQDAFSICGSRTPTHFGFVTPSGVRAGFPFPLTLFALDANGNLVITYSGTVHFTSSDGAATLPPDYSFVPTDRGQHGFNSSILRTPGFQTVTASDAVAMISSNTTILVDPPELTHFIVTASMPVQSGAVIDQVQVTAADANNNPVPSYRGAVHFTSSDGLAALPADYTFTAGDAGVHIFRLEVKLRTAGSQTISVSDALGIQGSASVSVHQTILLVQWTDNNGGIRGGVPFSVGVFVQDADNGFSLIQNFTDTIHFTSTDPTASLPPDYTFNGPPGIFFSVATMRTPGTQTITVTDTVQSGITGTTTNIIVQRTNIAFNFSNSNPQAGATFSLLVNPIDDNGIIVTGFRDTVHITNTDLLATLPGDYEFTQGDNGQHTFTGLILRTAGGQSMTVTDVAASFMTLTAPQNVLPTHLRIAAPPFINRNTPFSVTVSALDQNNAVVPAFGDTIHFTCTDGSATLPADYTYVPGDNGAHSFSGLILRTAGVQTLTATDTLTGAITGSANIQAL